MSESSHAASHSHAPHAPHASSYSALASALGRGKWFFSETNEEIAHKERDDDDDDDGDGDGDGEHHDDDDFSTPISWKPFDPELNETVEAMYASYCNGGDTRVQMKVRGQTYEMNFTMMTQKNISTQLIRQIQRRK
eukprot:TRINITY_DN11077_c0_g1_i1.p2 TRINITY_DN11077_c0_g1~~TRINITY_DN11077_c0_g1_i1.p2  ORF type:complete len:136 (-),score=30.25 TRINITY_DN11077_c0_g1_i1:91-498(-)